MPARYSHPVHGFAFLKYGESRKAAAKLVGGLTLKPEMPAEEEAESEATEE